MKRENHASLESFFLAAVAVVLIMLAGEGRAVAAAAAAAGRWQTAVEDFRSCCPTLSPRRSLLPTAGDSAARAEMRCSCTAGLACYRCSCHQPLQPRLLADSAWTCWRPVSPPRALRQSDAYHQHTHTRCALTTFSAMNSGDNIYHSRMRPGNAFGRVCLSCSCSNFRKPWPLKLHFWYAGTSSELFRRSLFTKVIGSRSRSLE